LKLPTAGSYYKVFWDQFDTKNCQHCNAVSGSNWRKANKGPQTPAERALSMNVKRGKCMGSCWPRDKKLRCLAALASIKFAAPDYGERQETRGKFNKHWSLKCITGMPCFLCGEEAHHRHHMIQLQHGGVNCQRNHVPLCRTCHTEVHKLAL
jgi:hypothetical protein